MREEKISIWRSTRPTIGIDEFSSTWAPWVRGDECVDEATGAVAVRGMHRIFGPASTYEEQFSYWINGMEIYEFNT